MDPKCIYFSESSLQALQIIFQFASDLLERTLKCVVGLMVGGAVYATSTDNKHYDYNVGGMWRTHVLAPTHGRCVWFAYIA